VSARDARRRFAHAHGRTGGTGALAFDLFLRPSDVDTFTAHGPAGADRHGRQRRHITCNQQSSESRAEWKRSDGFRGGPWVDVGDATNQDDHPAPSLTEVRRKKRERAPLSELGSTSSVRGLLSVDIDLSCAHCMSRAPGANDAGRCCMRWKIGALAGAAATLALVTTSHSGPAGIQASPAEQVASEQLAVEP
jgi:hypothetical protein